MSSYSCPIHGKKYVETIYEDLGRDNTTKYVCKRCTSGALYNNDDT